MREALPSGPIYVQRTTYSVLSLYMLYSLRLLHSTRFIVNPFSILRLLYIHCSYHHHTATK